MGKFGLSVAAVLGLTPVPIAAATYTATPQNFAAVFMAAHGGDTIKAVGNFGAVTLSNKSFTIPLKIDATAATFGDTLLLNGISGVTFSGGHYGSSVRATRYNVSVKITGGSRLTFHSLSVVGNGAGQGVEFIGASTVSVDHSTFDGLRSGVGVVSTTGATLTANLSIRSASDGFDIADSHNVTVTGNTCRDGVPAPGAHPDCVQLYSIRGRPVQSDITVLGNTALGPTQGFTAFNPDDGGELRVNFSRNIVTTSYSQGVACYACVDSVFADNVLTTLPGAAHKTNLNIIGGSNNLIFANSVNGTTAPDNPALLAGFDRAAEIAGQLAWTPPAAGGAGSAFGQALQPVAGVPEPSLWLTLVAGFALTGGAARGSRRRAALA